MAVSSQDPMLDVVCRETESCDVVGGASKQAGFAQERTIDLIMDYGIDYEGIIEIDPKCDLIVPVADVFRFTAWQ